MPRGDAGEAAARAAGGRARARRRHARRSRSTCACIAATNKDLREGDRGRPLPRGPLLPAQRGADSLAAAARAREDLPALIDAFLQEACREERARAADAVARGAGGADAPTTTRATCASCATWWSGWPSSARGRWSRGAEAQELLPAAQRRAPPAVAAGEPRAAPCRAPRPLPPSRPRVLRAPRRRLPPPGGPARSATRWRTPSGRSSSHALALHPRQRDRGGAPARPRARPLLQEDEGAGPAARRCGQGAHAAEAAGSSACRADAGELGWMVVRIAFGLTLALGHGLPKVMGGKWRASPRAWPSWASPSRSSSPGARRWRSWWAGCWWRWASSPGRRRPSAAFTMLVALFRHRVDPFARMELALLYFVVLAAAVVSAAGPSASTPRCAAGRPDAEAPAPSAPGRTHACRICGRPGASPEAPTSHACCIAAAAVADRL